MKTRQVNLRLEPTLLNELQQAADAEHLERGTMMRKLLIEALHGWRLEHALRRYQSGEFSIGRACEYSSRSHWEMMDLLRARGIVQHYDVEDALRRVRPMLKRLRDRVAEPQARYAVKDPTGPGVRADRGRRSRRREATGGDETLPDFPPGAAGILLVGINPAPASVNRGHYYQGKLGRRLWKRLEQLGLLTGALPGHEDEAFVRAGHGLTDVAKRATTSGTELDPSELRAGAEGLRARIREWKPRLVLFAFKKAAVAALGTRNVAAGPCGEIEGVPAFLLSGPFASREDTRRNDGELRRRLRDG